MLFFHGQEAKDFFAGLGEIFFAWVLVTIIFKILNFVGIYSCNIEFCNMNDIVMTFMFAFMYFFTRGILYLTSRT